MLSSAAAITATLLLASTLLSCASPQRKTLGQSIGASSERSDLELHAELGEFSYDLINTAEAVILEIRNETSDRRAFLAATWTLMRINAEVTRSMMYTDPTASLIDLWALTLQLIQYYESTPSIELGEEHRENLVAVMQNLHHRIDAIAAEFITENESGETVAAWVKQNPIQPAGFSRPSVAPLLAKFVHTRSGGLMGAAENIDLSVQQINFTLHVLNNQLPKQLIWRVELMIDQRLKEFEVGELTNEARDALALIDDIPNLVERERATILADIDRQRAEVMVDVDERIENIMSDVDQRIENIMGDVDQRIATVLTDVHSIRDSAVADAGTITDEAIAEIRAVVTDALVQADALRVDSHDRVDAHIATTLSDVQRLADALMLRLVIYTVVLLLVVGAFTIWRDRRLRTAA